MKGFQIPSPESLQHFHFGGATHFHFGSATHFHFGGATHISMQNISSILVSPTLGSCLNILSTKVAQRYIFYGSFWFHIPVYPWWSNQSRTSSWLHYGGNSNESFEKNICENENYDNNVLWISNCNPTQLIGKEHVIKEWGAGIWAFSETSATQAAQATIRSRLSLQGLTTIFGAPVAPQQSSQIYRRRTGGVAISSHLSCRPFIHPSPDFLYQSTRFLDCVV